MNKNEWKTVLKGALIGLFFGIFAIVVLYIKLKHLPIATTIITSGIGIWTIVCFYNYLKEKRNETNGEF